MISIVFPHLLNPENDRVLQLNLQMIKENTTCPYEVLYLADTGNRHNVYRGLDWLMRIASYDLILWHSSDILLAPGWDKNVLKHKDDGNWIGLELVECGQIGVHPNNIHKDFGITAESFQRVNFENWVAEHSANRPSFRNGFCWYSPSVWKKAWYITMGGFDLEHTFPHPVDSLFKERVEKLGCKFIVANSFAYHFQRAGENLGEKKERA